MWRFLAWSLFLLPSVPGQTLLPGNVDRVVQVQSSSTSVSNICQGFIGEWTGVLEYRDFQSDDRVKLPTWLTVQASPDGASLDFAYTYDDGPNKIVKEISRVTVDSQTRTFTFTSDRDNSRDVYQLSGIESFAAAGRGTLQLTGSGSENGKKVDVRITIKLGRNSYTYQKETRLAGADFLFRDGYTLVRRNPPAAR